jgi:hypothetical protein
VGTAARCTSHPINGRPRKADADESEFDHHDLRPEATHLEAQRVAKRLDGMLGRVVVVPPGKVSLPPMDERLTILPKPCHLTPGKTSWHMRASPKTFVSNWRRTDRIRRC